MEFIIRYQLKNGKHKVINSETKLIATEDTVPMGINRFIMLQQSDSEANDTFLVEYLDRFNGWCDEIQDKVFRYEAKFDYRECFSDYGAVVRVFNYYCKKNYKKHQPITPVEYKWFRWCHNGGIQYLRENNITLECYGYDFISFYALILNSDLLIPTKPGKEVILTELPKKLKHGFYRVKITCENDNFRKIFGFSHADTYLNISLEIAIKYRKKFKVEINLIQDGEPNAYLYEDSDMVELKPICEKWYNKLAYLKRKFPKNRLVKHMLSSAPGHLNAKNTVNKTFEEIEEMRAEGITVGMKDTNDFVIHDVKEFDDKEYYVLLNTKSPYQHNIRLIPFVTARGRNEIGKVAMLDIDSVVRIHTDGIVFDKPMELDNVDILPEQKTTGKIHFKHCNNYNPV
jgi:hypothetical protein